MSPSCTLDPGLEPFVVDFKTGQQEGQDGRSDDGVTFLWEVLGQSEEAENSSDTLFPPRQCLHTPQGEAACSCGPVTRLLPALEAPVTWSYLVLCFRMSLARLRVYGLDPQNFLTRHTLKPSKATA